MGPNADSGPATSADGLLPHAGLREAIGYAGVERGLVSKSHLYSRYSDGPDWMRAGADGTLLAFLAELQHKAPRVQQMRDRLAILSEQNAHLGAPSPAHTRTPTHTHPRTQTPPPLAQALSDRRHPTYPVNAHHAPPAPPE